MAERTLFPEWRKQNDPTKYPFSDRARLVNGSGRVIVEGTFLDAAVHPVGVGSGVYLSKAVVTFQSATLYVGVPGDDAVASGEFSLLQPPDQVTLADAYGRPAGVLVSEGVRLALFRTWGVGTHEFEPADTEFAASCVFPTPEVGVRGVRLDTGELFVGDVWLVGDDGVVLRASTTRVPDPATGLSRTVTDVRVDVVGDPLFRRRLCTPTDLFQTPRFIRRVRVVGPNDEFVCEPDAAGDLKLTTANDLAADTVLRIGNTAEGLLVHAAGSFVNQ
jgi:hypothetical protein